MTNRNFRKIGILGVPSSAGARRAGQERGPDALRDAGLIDRLRERGHDVADIGDLPGVRYRPDRSNPRAQNLASVVEECRRVAERVRSTVAEGRTLLVLGGDCSLTIGIIAGLIPGYPRLGLWYFDADLDLNTPQTTPSGVFDGMVLAHLLGHGAPELAGIGSRRPLLSGEHIVVFGYDADSGWIDPPELELLAASSLTRYALTEVRAAPAQSAAQARAHLELRSDAVVLHFDVDVTNTPAVDVPHPGGLEFAEASAALNVFVASPACAAVVVTELNPDRDPRGVEAERVTAMLVNAFDASEVPPP